LKKVKDQNEIVFKSILKSEPSNLKVVSIWVIAELINHGTKRYLTEKLKLPTNRGRLFYKYGGALGMKALGVNNKFSFRND
jgi:abortive infection bacteriophage resistance protein